MLQQNIQRHDDWIWIADHTYSVGTVKVLAILGIRRSHFISLQLPVQHQDLVFLEMLTVESSNGLVVEQQFEELAAKVGNPLAILRFSIACGHLSLMAATQGDDGNPQAKDPIDRISSRTQAVVEWFSPTDMVNWQVPKGFVLLAVSRPDLFDRIFGEIKDFETQLKDISPINYVGKDSPPLLLIHGDAYKTVPLQQSTIMKAKYEELGRTAKLVVQPGGGHSSWPGIMDQYPIVWDWFQTHLKKGKQ